MVFNQPKVSVIIPYFNRPLWCKDAIKSVLAQSYRNFEIIVVDDGSDKRLSETFDVGGYPMIRYERQDHLGVSFARNRGINLARGKYIAFLDDDDIFLPDKLLIQVEAMENFPEYAMSYSHALMMNEDGFLIAGKKWGGNVSGNIYPELLFIKNSFITVPTVMIRIGVLKEVGGFNVAMNVCEDLDLWRRIAKGRKILHIQKNLAVIRQHPDGKAKIEDSVRARKIYYELALAGDGSLGYPFKADLMAEMYLFYGLQALSRKQCVLGTKLVAKAIGNSAFFAFRYLSLTAFWKIKESIKQSLRRFLPASAYNKVIRFWRFANKRTNNDDPADQ